MQSPDRCHVESMRSNLQLREKVKHLESFLSVCANCRKTRNEEGKWLSLEQYMEAHENKKISHGICPDCREALYGDYFTSKKARKKNVSTAT